MSGTTPPVICGRCTGLVTKHFRPDECGRLENWRRGNAEHHWHPNQLRHAVGTELRKRFGLEAAQVVLGHATADVTQIYAERDMGLAIDPRTDCWKRNAPQPILMHEPQRRPIGRC